MPARVNEEVKHAPFWVGGSASFEINSFFAKAKHRIRKRSYVSESKSPNGIANFESEKAQMESEGAK